MADFEIAGYEIYERLGRGGMATVYRALHLNLDREVAVKIMDTALNSDATFSERFIREARISARLVHPQILQIYDVNASGSLNYISMELLGGGDLGDVIRRAMTQKTIYTVMSQMTDALDYAARQGYVHRDIKPSNIMLRGDGDYVLADFGIAKAANSGTQMTQTGLLVGTPSYMSPEQAKGIEVDGRSDLYGLAVLCYEMLTKQLPYDSDSAVSTAVKHLTEDIPTLPEHLAAYQPFLDKALAKDADDRYQTGRELFEGLSEVRGEFSDTDVLTEPEDTPEEEQAAREDSSATDLHTSAAWSDQTRVSQSMSSSRPYKLTGQDDLISGIRPDQRSGIARPAAGGNNLVKLLGAAAIAGVAAFAGYTYWQDTQGTSTKDMSALTAELAKAYTALNNNELEQAAVAFHHVLEVDSRHGAALQGLSDVEAGYQVAVSRALASGELSRVRQLLLDHSLQFPASNRFEQQRAALDLALQEQRLASVQSDRVGILVNKANEALQADKLFKPPLDNAYYHLQQAIALDASNTEASKALSELLGAALAQVSRLIDDKQLADARALLSEVETADPAYPALRASKDAIVQAEENELRRQGRWADYSEEQRQAILAQLAKAEDLLVQKQLLGPGDDNAYSAFLAVLELDPGNEMVARGLNRIADAYITEAEIAAAENEFDAAELALSNAGKVAPDYQPLMQARERFVATQQSFGEQAEFNATLDNLIARAGQELALIEQEPVRAAEATRLYLEVLELSSSNETAVAAIVTLTQFYLSSAEQAVTAGEFAAAQSALDSAQALAPNDPDIGLRLAALPELETEWVTSQNINVLLETGQQLSEQGELKAAATKFGTALKLEPGNSTAQESLSATIEALFSRARQAIEQGEFDVAATDLADAKQLAPERSDIAELQQQLPELEQTWQHDQAITQGLAQANGLYKKARFSKAATAFNAVLAISPDSGKAREGLAKSVDALVRDADSLMNKGDFPAARKNLTAAIELAPEHKVGAALLAELPQRQTQWQEQQAAAEQQRQFAEQKASSGARAIANGELDAAKQTYDQLAAEYPEIDATIGLKNQLLAAYISATRAEINNEEYDSALDYLARGQALAPNNVEWLELETEIETSRANNSRRLGAY